MTTLLLFSVLALIPRASFVSLALAGSFILWGLIRRKPADRLSRAAWIGALVPLCGVLPDFVAGLLFLALLALERDGVVRRSSLWGAPFLSVMMVWALARVVYEFDVAPFVSLYHGYEGAGSRGIQNILRWIRGAGPQYLVACEDVIKVFVIVGLASSLEGERGRAFGRGLIFGGVVCAVAAIAEVVAPGTFATLRAPSPFWAGIHRAQGFATDPNALGVLVGALIPIVLEAFGRRGVPFVALLVIGGLLSGSRTFFLIPLITAGYLVARAKGWRVTAAAGVLGICLCVLVVFSMPYLPQAPTGLVRLRDSLDLSRLSETLHSRTVFTTLSLSVFKDFPLFGVGLGRFDEYVVPYAHQLNLGIGVWRDGAVSVYLEILAELGLIGAVFFLVSFFARVAREDGSSVLKGVGLAYLVILALLPHTNFAEGVALAGLLLAQTTRARVSAQSPLILPTAVLISLSIPCFYSSRALYGFYPWEKAGSEFVRWTALEAVGAVPCATEVPLRLRNETPIAQSVEVVSGEKRESAIVPQGGSYEPVLGCENGRARYRLNVFPGFTPSKYGFMGDERLLGIRQLSSEPVL